ncbi:biofilm formation regulator BssR [Escherichia coli]
MLKEHSRQPQYVLLVGYHDCPTVITVNADRLENCLMSLTLRIQSLQKHAMLEKA